MNFPLLQGAPAPSASSSLLQMVPFLLVFFIFYYFVLLAPMRKQKKKTQEMLSALKKGDRVVTASGIHGSVAAIEDQVVWVKIADTVKVKMSRSAISTVLAEGEVAKDQAPS
jgi:preprotein translocase subunit YajC